MRPFQVLPLLLLALILCTTSTKAQTLRGTRLFLVDTSGGGRDTTTVLTGANGSRTLVLPPSGTTGSLLWAQQSNDSTKMLWLAPGAPNQTLTIDAMGNPSWSSTGTSFWSLSGNAGVGNTAILGTTDAELTRLGAFGIPLLHLDGIYESIYRVESTTPRGFGANDFQAGSTSPDQVAGAEYSFIGGGQENAITIGSEDASIVSGVSNRIDASRFSFIGAGRRNAILTGTGHNVITGGEDNQVNNSDNSTIVGGEDNAIESGYGSFVGGGVGNFIRGDYSVTGGGSQNELRSDGTVIAGGVANAASADFSAVVGGLQNSSSGALSFIGSGQFNLTIDSFSVVVGGLRNFAELPYDAVVGGLNNRANGSYSFVGGGFFNQVDPDINVASRFSSILGGAYNDIRGRYSAIMGGHGLRLGEGQVGFRRPRNPLTVAQEATDSWVGRDDGAIFVNTHMTLANDGATVQSQLRLYEQRANGQDYVGIRAPTAVANNVVFTLPGTTGTAGQVLTTDGTGNLSWAAASASAPTGVSFAVIGADYVVDADDQVLIYAANAANANITLPPTATSAGRQIHVINMAGGGNVTFVDAANAAVPVRMYRFNGGWITSSTLSGTVNLAANQGLGGSIGNSVTILCDGFFWYAIAR